MSNLLASARAATFFGTGVDFCFPNAQTGGTGAVRIIFGERPSKLLDWLGFEPYSLRDWIATCSRGVLCTDAFAGGRCMLGVSSDAIEYFFSIKDNSHNWLVAGKAKLTLYRTLFLQCPKWSPTWSVQTM